MNNAVILLSGGQDSTTCFFYAKKYYEKLFAIIFKYGQSHYKEVEVAKQICSVSKVDFDIIEIPFFHSISKSALLSNIEEEIGDKHPDKKDLPASFVPNRNLLFLTIAHAMAQKLEYSNIIAGFSQTDYSGYPDCREEFVKAFELAANTGSNSNIKIITPLMRLSKADTFKLAEQLECLQTILSMTITCYYADPSINHWGKGCGKCPSCILRKEGYFKYISLYGNRNEY